MSSMPVRKFKNGSIWQAISLPNSDAKRGQMLKAQAKAIAKILLKAQSAQ